MSSDDARGPGEERHERLSIGCRVVQSRGVLAADSDGELLLIREETAECFALRGSGVEIWKAARTPAAIGTICEALRRIYAVDAETCERNVLRQVEELLGRGLFVRAL
jgi:hypothetical protein